MPDRPGRPDRTPAAGRPDKLCPACGRPFAWRRKWARDWDRVVFCSERCRRAGRPDPGPGPGAGR